MNMIFCISRQSRVFLWTSLSITMWVPLGSRGARLKVPPHTRFKVWQTAGRLSPVPPMPPAASSMISCAVTFTTSPWQQGTGPVTAPSLTCPTSWQVYYHKIHNIHLLCSICFFLHECVSPLSSTLLTHKCPSKHFLWTPHCHCILAAEQPRCGIRRLPWQPKWTQRLLRWRRRRYELRCLWAELWLRLQSLGQGTGKAVQQHRQLCGLTDIRYQYQLIWNCANWR